MIKTKTHLCEYCRLLVTDDEISCGLCDKCTSKLVESIYSEIQAEEEEKGNSGSPAVVVYLVLGVIVALVFIAWLMPRSVIG